MESVVAPSNQDLGRKLRELREQRGIRRERLALDLDMSAGNWAHYEGGRNQINAWMLPTIAESLKMGLAELLSELYGLDGPCQTVATSDNGSQNKSTANYNYTESARSGFGPLPPSYARDRELVAAGR
jgi:transcriptional regulator with XRE-family HTH domain